MNTRAMIGIMATAFAASVPGGLAYSGTAEAFHLAVDPADVDCSSFVPRSQVQCLRTADEMYRLLELIFSQVSDGNLAEAFQETTPRSAMLYPDGSLAYGIEGFNSKAAALIGSSDYAFVGARGDYRFKPLDNQTVLLLGIAEFVYEDYELGGELREISFVQTNVFRRNRRLPRGWEQVAEQIAYPAPLRGD